jgi:hypothetical protein
VRCRGRSVRLLVGAVLGLLVITDGGDAHGSVSAKSSSPRLVTIARATEAAGTARIVATNIAGSGERSVTKVRGVIDFVHDRAEFVAEGRDRGGVPSISTVRLAGGYIFTPNSPKRGEEPQTPSKPWLRSWASRGQDELALLISGDVGAGLRSLDDAGPVVRVGTEKVRGTPTVHYRFKPARGTVPRQVRAMNPERPRIATYDIWVDRGHRLRRFVQAGTSGKRSRDVVEAELFDFAVPVTVVEPVPDQVKDDEIDGLTGDWRLVRRGRANGNAWRIYRARTELGSCFAHETDPRGPRVVAAAPDQRGRAQDTCVYDRDRPDDPVPPPKADLSTTAVALPNGMALLYGRVLPDEQRLTLRFANGHRRRLHPKHGTFAVALPADVLVNEIVTDIEGQKTHCRLDRTFHSFDCTGGRFTIAPEGRGL